VITGPVTEAVADLVEQATPVVDTTMDTVTEAVAGTPVAPLVETAREPVDQLVAGVDATVESGVEPSASTVDTTASGPAQPFPGPVQPMPGPAQPIPGPAPQAPLGPVPSLLMPAIHAPVGQAQDAVAATAGAETGHDPAPARPPRPLAAGATHQLTGAAQDPGHPWPWTGPPAAPYEPDHGHHRSVDDITFSALVMSDAVPPG
jgi:hypothetical protein